MWLKSLFHREKKEVVTTTYIDKKGFVRFKDTNDFVHLWVAENMLGRELIVSEFVCHKDKNKLNNSTTNILVCDNREEEHLSHKLGLNFRKVPLKLFLN